MVEIFIINHKNKIFLDSFFLSENQARNILKFKFPKINFKEIEPNVFVCGLNGSKFQIIKLIEYYNNNQDDCVEATLMSAFSLRDNFFSLEDLRYAYEAGEDNIDSDACHIENSNENFKKIVDVILKNK